MSDTLTDAQIAEGLRLAGEYCMMDAYQHGIQTVENVLNAWATRDGKDTQVNAVLAIGQRKESTR